MNTEQNTIWQKLETYSFDDLNASHPFSTRLAKENGWSRSKTERMLLEYKRFLLLAASAGHPVSPSDSVDQAWHLHLLYTRSYWDELCPGVLCFNPHHEPSTGGAIETEKI